MKKKLIATAVAAIALVGTVGATTAFAAEPAPSINDFANQAITMRMEARSGTTDEQRADRFAARSELFAQVFGGEITLPTMSDEQVAERQATRAGFITQAFEDGVISQEMFNLMMSSIETGRGTELNAEQRMANRNALWGQLTEDGGLSQELLDTIFSARASGERAMGGGRGGWLLQQ